MAEITFTGNVGNAPELRHTRQGTPVLSFRACDSKSRQDGNGGWETLAETWYNVALYGPAAEAQQHEITKGARVKVAGEFYTRPYEGKNGAGVSNDVRAVGVQVIPTRGGQQGGQTPGGFGGGTPQQSGGWGGTQDGWGAQPTEQTWGGGATGTQNPPF